MHFNREVRFNLGVSGMLYFLFYPGARNHTAEDGRLRLQFAGSLILLHCCLHVIAFFSSKLAS